MLKMNMNFRKRVLLKCFAYFLSVFVFCEYLIYYVVIFQCSWPKLNNSNLDSQRPVYAMFIADTHLLGKRNGHWFDKLRREWQMHRAFQTATTLHYPELVFVLGDVFDEGLWCSGIEFDDYVDRFHSLFSVPDETKLYAIVGNHDVGFHYRITPYLSDRFVTRMKSPPVQMISVRGNHFILLNSMAMEGDGCFLCHKAETALNNITNVLQCLKGTRQCSNLKLVEEYSRPILLQHFPLYRISDEMCTQSDAAPLMERNTRFRERWDCLSRESTEFLVDRLRPRVVLGGHTHHGCYITHTISSSSSEKMLMIEYSVPSFSWRNRNDPSFMLGVFTREDFKISKCRMPQESTVINLYLLAATLWVIYMCILIKRHRNQTIFYRKIY